VSLLRLPALLRSGIGRMRAGRFQGDQHSSGRDDPTDPRVLCVRTAAWKHLKGQPFSQRVLAYPTLVRRAEAMTTRSCGDPARSSASSWAGAEARSDHGDRDRLRVEWFRGSPNPRAGARSSRAAAGWRAPVASRSRSEEPNLRTTQPTRRDRSRSDDGSRAGSRFRGRTREHGGTRGASRARDSGIGARIRSPCASKDGSAGGRCASSARSSRARAHSRSRLRTRGGRGCSARSSARRRTRSDTTPPRARRAARGGLPLFASWEARAASAE
jgi:hypothetical protein